MIPRVIAITSAMTIEVALLNSPSRNTAWLFASINIERRCAADPP